MKNIMGVRHDKKVLFINGSPNEYGCTDVVLLKAGEAAENAGITKPEYEDVTFANFILD